MLFIKNAAHCVLRIVDELLVLPRSLNESIQRLPHGFAATGCAQQGFAELVRRISAHVKRGRVFASHRWFRDLCDSLNLMFCNATNLVAT